MNQPGPYGNPYPNPYANQYQNPYAQHYANAPQPIPPSAQEQFAPEQLPPELSVNPIIEERQIGRFELLRNRPPVRSNISVVLVKSNGEHIVFPPGNRPTAGKLIWKDVRTLYQIDMGVHQVRFEADVPSHGDALRFQAVVDVEWRVSNASLVIANGIRDVKEALRPSVFARVRKITRKFDIEQAESAEDTIEEALKHDPLGAEFGLLTR